VIEAPVSYQASTENRGLSIINLDILEEQAKEKMPEYGYAFVSGAAGDDWTMRENRRAFEDYPIVTHRMTGTSSKTSTTWAV
jgi:lactate oxidase